MGEVSVQVTEPRRRPVRRPGPSQIKMCGFCRPFCAMDILVSSVSKRAVVNWRWSLREENVKRYVHDRREKFATPNLSSSPAPTSLTFGSKKTDNDNVKQQKERQKTTAIVRSLSHAHKLHTLCSNRRGKSRLSANPDRTIAVLDQTSAIFHCTIARLAATHTFLMAEISRHALRQDPLEAILVIFGRRALIFFRLKGLGKKWKMTPILCACAVVITLETQKCRKRAPRSVEFNFFNDCDRQKRFSQNERRRADLQIVPQIF